MLVDGLNLGTRASKRNSADHNATFDGIAQHVDRGPESNLVIELSAQATYMQLGALVASALAARLL